MLKFIILYEKVWESYMSCNNYEKENFNIIYKGVKSDKFFCCNDEVLLSEV